MADSGISEDLQCPLCLDLFDQPITLGCQHSYCRQCLISTFKNDKSCPLCRVKLSIDVKELQKMTPNPILRSLVEQHQKYGNCEGCNQHSKISACFHCEKRICSDCRMIHKPNLYKEVKEICGRMQLLRSDVITELGKNIDAKAALLIEKETKIRQLEEEYSHRISGIDNNSTELRINVVKFNTNEERAKLYLDNWMTTSSDIINHFKNDVDTIVNPSVSYVKKKIKDKSSNVAQCIDKKTDSCITEAAFNVKTDNQNISSAILELPLRTGDYNIAIFSQVDRPPEMINIPAHVEQIVATATDIYGILPSVKSIIRISIDDYSIKEVMPIYGAGEPQGLALLPDGAFVVSDSNRKSIVTVKNGRNRLLLGNKCENKMLLNMPSGISVKGDYIAIADKDNDRILVINLEGQFIRNFGKRHLKNPGDVCITPDNSFCVVDDYGLKKFGKGGDLISEERIASMFDRDGYLTYGPMSVTCDRDGNILVADDLSHSVRVLDNSLNLKHAFKFPDHYPTPSSLCVLENGYIAVGLEPTALH